MKEEFDNIMDILHENSEVNISPNDTVSIRIGNKLLKFQTVEETILPSDELEVDIKKKYQDKLKEVRDFISEKYNKMTESFDFYKNEYDNKEKELNKKLKEANIMPDISYEHAKKGLSLVKGESGNLIWLYRGVYWPKYIDEKPIDPKYSKKLITPIIIEIETNEHQVVDVKTKRIVDLERFKHYHSYGYGDCWGSWSPSREEWKTVDDIVEIGKRAIGILENINSLSLGSRSPEKLPKFNTLEKHIVESGDLEYSGSRNDDRLGDITNEETTNSVTNMWTA